MDSYTEIQCSKCGQSLFYIPQNYKMGIEVICLPCGDGLRQRKRKLKKKTSGVRNAVANYAMTKKGIRKDIHPTYSFRSATEANIARLLKYLGVSWTFEERVFTFDGYKTRPHVYVMDFQVQKVDKRKNVPHEITEGFIEVKGWMRADSRQKLRRLKKHYPDEASKTTVIIYDHKRKQDIEFCEKNGFKFLFYDLLKKEYAERIENWE
jgi:hypothetical protein